MNARSFALTAALCAPAWLGLAQRPASPPPPPVAASCAAASCERGPVDVSLGSDFGCGLAADASVRCWGRSTAGQTGREAERVERPTAVPGLDRVATVKVGYSHACALREGGEVWCWGDNQYGQLGVEGPRLRAAPAPVPGLTDVRELAVGAFFSCALRGDGAVLCWGSDDTGNLGRGRERTHSATPSLVPGVRATRLWAGRSFACARERARVRCWGSSEHAQAGTRRRVRAARPTVLRGVGLDEELVLGGSYGCAIGASGRVRCWGQNLFHAVDPAIELHPAPVEVERLRGTEQISVVTDDVCALQGGEVRCQGVNRRQHLHVPTDEAGGVVIHATALPGVRDATRVVTGYFTQCIARRSGEWACWGWNRGDRVSAVGVGSREAMVSTPTTLPW